MAHKPANRVACFEQEANLHQAVQLFPGICMIVSRVSVFHRRKDHIRHILFVKPGIKPAFPAMEPSGIVQLDAYRKIVYPRDVRPIR